MILFGLAATGWLCNGEVSLTSPGSFIASIEDPAVINQVLAHLDEKAATLKW